MGREVKRVPLDFAHPMGVVWPGYLNPHFKPCPKAATNECHSGYTSDGLWMDAICRFLALVGEQAVETPRADELRARGRVFPHPYLQEFPQAPRTEMPEEARARIMALPDPAEQMREHHRYTAAHPPQVLPLGTEMVEFITGLARKAPEPPFGGSLEWAIRKALLKAAGIDPDGQWGACKTCDGHGIDPEVREAYEAWEREEPPTGEGWQLWGTVSEGNPVSPVFREPIDLARWLVANDTSITSGLTVEQWMAFLTGPGWAPAMIGGPGGLVSGVEALTSEVE